MKQIAISEQIERLGKLAVNTAFSVHIGFGHRLLGNANEPCFVNELELTGAKHQRQLPIPPNYKGKLIEEGFQADVAVEQKLLTELKGVNSSCPSCSSHNRTGVTALFVWAANLLQSGLDQKWHSQNSQSSSFLVTWLLCC